MSNEEQIIALSYALELITLFSIAVAVLVLWRNRQGRRTQKPKDTKPPGSRLGSMMDDYRRD